MSIIDQNPDQHRFNTKRLTAYMRADEAAKSKGITDLQRAQLTAVAKLAGIQFTVIRGIADDKDAEALRDDLIALWRIVDPLIEAMGQYAAEHFDGLDQSEFKDVLQGALDGNATFVLDDVAESIREERAEIEANPRDFVRAERVEADADV